MNTVRCIIVDDEPLARQRFRSLLHKITLEEEEYEIIICAEAESGTQAIPIIYTEKPDIVFLDIQMPGLNGFDVIDLLAEPRPHIVFVTAYDEYALKAFEVHALDYITKPINAERLNKTLQRIISVQNKNSGQGLDTLRTERANNLLQRITVHTGNSLRVVSLHEIKRIEAENKSVYVYLPDNRYSTDFTLDTLELRLDPKQFIRVHRSHLVRIDAIKELIPWFSGTYCLRLEDGTQLPVARRRVNEIKKIFGR